MNAAQREETPRVAILVDTSTGWGRRLVSGIHQYTRKHQPWHLWIEPRGQHEHLRPPPGWKGEGIIARVSTPLMARELSSMRVPVVNVSGVRLRGHKTFPTVTTDQSAVGRLAAEHLMERGFRHFAYFGVLRFAYVAEQYGAFRSLVEEAGCTCDVYRPPPRQLGWKARQAALVAWLRNLPRPVAILTWARQGLRLLDACRWAGLYVPDDVAVLESDEDELLNELPTPPLSGIEVPSERIGQEAAAMLERLMGGQAPAEPRVLLQPSHVVVRQSTNTLAIEEADLAEAIRFVRENACRAITVDDVLRQVPMSRRSLERRFEAAIGRTPGDEIRRLRIERAKQLLAETDIAIPAVAAAAGFGSPEYLSFAFKMQAGMTPLKYRKHVRAR